MTEYRRSWTRSHTQNGTRFYKLTDQHDPDFIELFPSVTSIIKVLDRPALMFWWGRVMAEWLIDNHDEWHGKERAAALDLAKKAPRQQRDQAGNRGSRIHSLIERLIRGETIDDLSDEEIGFLRGFAGFHKTFNPEYLFNELAVFNRTYNYAGTGDLILRLPGSDLPQILDIKTGRGIYSEVQLQLAAYAWSEFFIDDDGQEQPLPELSDVGLVLHLHHDGTYALHPTDVGEKPARAFVAARRLWEWGQDKEVIAPPLEAMSTV